MRFLFSVVVWFCPISVALTSDLLSCAAARVENPLVFQGGGDYVSALVFSSDSNSILVASLDGKICQWSMSNQAPRKLVEFTHDRPVNDISVSSDGLIMASGSTKDDLSVGETKIWDLKSCRLSKTLVGHKSHVSSVSLSRNGKLLSTGGSDGRVIIWDLASGRSTTVIECGKDIRAAFSFPGDNLVAASWDGIIRVWKGQYQLPSLVIRQNGRLHRFCVSSDANIIAASSSSKENLNAPDEILIWSNKSTEAIGRFSGHTGRIKSICFSSDGKHLVSGGSSKKGSGEVAIWNLETRAMRLCSFSEMVTCVSWSRNNKIAIGFFDGTVRVTEPTLPCVEKQAKTDSSTAGLSDELDGFRGVFLSRGVLMAKAAF